MEQWVVLQIHRALLVLLCVAALPACGQIGLGGNPYLLEPAPDGTLVYIGTFSTLDASHPVTGTAQIYRSTSGDTLRVASLSAPTDVGALSLVGQGQQGSTSRQYTTTLKSSRGDQNYSTGLSAMVWSTVTIRTAANPSAQPYGTAVLQAVTQSIAPSTEATFRSYIQSSP